MALSQFNRSISPVALLTLLILQGFLEKIESFKAIEIVGYIDELITVYIVTYLISNIKAILNCPRAIVFSVFYFLYLGVGWFSSLVNEVAFNQTFLQGLLDAKFYFVAMYCVLIYRDQVQERSFEYFISLLLFINLPFIVWQFVLGSSYDAVFSSGAHTGLLYTDEGAELTRAAGIYWHPGILGSISALTVGFFYIKVIFAGERTRRNIVCLSLAILELTLTLSRGEIGACVLSVVFITLFYNKSILFRAVVTVTVFATASIYFSSYPKMLTKSLSEVGLTELTWETTPRALLMHSALDIANDNFPIGSGLGTYGGLSADLYDSELYYKYHFSTEWWFGERLFLKDTFWPKIIGETGALGTAAMAVFILVPIFFGLYSKRSIFQIYSVYAVMVLFVISFSSPVYNAPLYVLFAFIYWGSLFGVKQKND